MPLVDITYSREYNRTRYGVDRAEQTSALYGPSLDAALRKIVRLSGVLPGVRYPLGGARTKEQCNSLGTSWTISDHYEGRPARAVDIDNRGEITTGIARKQGVTFTRAVQIYYSTFAEFGWRNITTDGQAFPSEPWHLANHSTTPAGSGGVPLPGTSELKESEMYILGCSTRPVDQRYVMILPYGHQLMTDGAYDEEKGLMPSKNVDQVEWDRHIARAEARELALLNSFKAVIPAPSGGTTITPDVIQAIGTEVIRQQKLPGN